MASPANWFDPETEGWFDPEDGAGWFDPESGDADSDQTLTPPLVTSTGTGVFEPALSLVLTPPAVAGGGTVRNPSLTLVLEPPAVAGGGTVYAPSLDLVLAPPAVEGQAGGAVVSPPSLSLVLTPPAVAGGGDIYPPDIADVGLVLEPPAVEGGGAVYGPSLTLVVEPPAVAGGGAVYAPALAPVLEPPAIAATGSLFAPSFTLVLAPPVVAGGGAVYAPSLAPDVELVAGNKPDTRLHVGADSIEADQSQYRTDLVASGAGAYELGSARLGLELERCIEVLAILDGTSAGTMVDCGTQFGDAPYRLQAAAGDLVFYAGGDTHILALPGGAETYLVAWSTQANPLTTGASDVLRSEALIFNEGTGDLSRTWWVHPVGTPDVDDSDFAIGGYWDGAALADVLTDGTIVEVRIGSRFHTGPESREDFQAITAAADVDGYQVTEQPRLPPQVLEVDWYAGPAYQVPTIANLNNRLRLTSPLVQSIWRPSPVIGFDLADTWSTKWVVDLANDYQTAAPLWWVRSIPRTCGWVLCRVQLAVWNPIDTPGEVEIRLTTSTKRPLAGGVSTSVSITRDTDDGADGDGVVLELPRCYVHRDADARTWLWLSMKITGANAADTVYAIREITIVPLSVPALEDEGEPIDGYGP